MGARRESDGRLLPPPPRGPARARRNVPGCAAPPLGHQREHTISNRIHTMNNTSNVLIALIIDYNNLNTTTNYWSYNNALILTQLSYDDILIVIMLLILLIVTMQSCNSTHNNSTSV